MRLTLAAIGSPLLRNGAPVKGTGSLRFVVANSGRPDFRAAVSSLNATIVRAAKARLAKGR